MSWIGYAVFLTLGTAAVIAAAAGDEISGDVAGSIVLLGVATELGFAADAFNSANQAEELATHSILGAQPFAAIGPFDSLRRYIFGLRWSL